MRESGEEKEALVSCATDRFFPEQMVACRLLGGGEVTTPQGFGESQQLSRGDTAVLLHAETQAAWYSGSLAFTLAS